jgi:hypothetical protein
MKKYVTGIALSNFIVLSLIISFILILYSIFLSNHVIIKNQEKQLSNINYLKLILIRFLHYFTFTFLNLFPFLVYPIIFYDIIYVILSILIIFLYYLNGECILTINEKQLLDPSYKKGDNEKYQPYMEVLLESKYYNSFGIEFFIIIVLFVLIRIIYRLCKK